MRERSISLTEAARNFAECINRAHYQGATFVLLKNGVPVARIVPESKRLRTGRELAAALANVHLPAEESEAWLRELEGSRKKIGSPVDRWQS
jgi:prevent-host-death family protein